MTNLLPKSDIKVVRFADGEVDTSSEHFKALKELILFNEGMYPKISNWFDKKVLPGIRNSERVAFVAYEDEKPVASAVIKRAENSKFCHLRIEERLRNRNLGELFFVLMASETRHYAKEIHFTLPESLWEDKFEFFNSFGFHKVEKSTIQYRSFAAELRCSTTFAAVWQSAVDKLPKLLERYTINSFSSDNVLLLSVTPKYAKDILSGKKRIEVRRRFSTKWIGHRVTFYATAPLKSIVGEATIENVIKMSPDILWSEFAPLLGCEKNQLEQYAKGCSEIYAIFLGEVNPYISHIPTSQLSYLLKTGLNPPQSYFDLKRNKNWTKAISVASLLHGCLVNSVRRNL